MLSRRRHHSVLVNKPRDLRAKCFGFQQLADRSRRVENLPLQRNRQGVPLHDDGCTETTQHMLFLAGKSRTTGSGLLCNGIVKSVREDLLAVSKRGEAILQLT